MDPDLDLPPSTGPWPGQEISSGETPAQKYAKLGGHTGPQFKQLSAVVGFIASVPKMGKTALLEGNPDAFFFNLDGSSTVNPSCKATKWPGIKEDGTLAEVITWEKVDAKLRVLEQLARNKDPDRPACIVFDSLSAMLESVIDYVTRNAKSLSLVGNDRDAPDHFSQLNGQPAWDMVYNIITQSINRLRNTGYGVWVLGHVVNKNVILNDSLLNMPELTITDGFWKRLFPRFDFSGVIVAETRPQYETIKDPRTGRERRNKTGDEVIRKLSIDYHPLKSILGARVPIETTIELPLDGGWDAFAAAYNAAIERAVTGVPHE